MGWTAFHRLHTYVHFVLIHGLPIDEDFAALLAEMARRNLDAFSAHDAVITNVEHALDII